MRKLLFALIFSCLLAGCAGTSPVRTVPIGAVDIGYRITGQGEPLLMIMGYGGTMDAWDARLVELLAQHYQVILFDNRNVGYSATSPDRVTISGMAQDGLKLLDALGIKRAHVLGWSMGSIIAQEMALRRPEKIGKLILYGSAFERQAIVDAVQKFDGITPDEFIAMLFPEAWARQHPDVYARLPKPTVPASPDAIQRQRQAVMHWKGGAGRLGSLNRDVLIVAGEADRILPVEQSLKLAESIEGAWLVRFKGAGHWLMYQAPDELAAVVLQFLGSKQNLIH